MRPCTCHPDDNPPVPCAQVYAYSECVRAARTWRYRWRFLHYWALRLFAVLALMLASWPAYAQKPHITGNPINDIKSDFNDLQKRPQPPGSIAEAIQKAQNGPASCDFNIFRLINPTSLSADIQACGQKLLDDSQAALDSATNARDTTAIACLTPGTALIKAGVGTPGTPEVPANPGNPTATPPVPATPEVPATEPKLGGPILLFQKYREFVNAGGISACESWVNTVIAAQVGTAAGAVAGAAILAPKIP